MPKYVTNNFKNKKLNATNEKAQHGPNVFLGLQGVKVKEGFFIFLLFPMCS
jgi:hypothetical protein